MTTNRSASRPKGAPGARALITSAALAATLAGWATLSAQAHAESAPAEAARPPAWLGEAPSIPALPEVATVRGTGAAPLAAAPAPALRQVTAPQPAARPAALPLAPVASTRSSR